MDNNTTIIAREGYTITNTDNSIFSKLIFLGKNDSSSNYYEITDEAAEAIRIRQEAIPERTAVNYDDLVEQKIRQRYTISAEFAVLRQKEEKPVEYTEYYNYCEQCKQEAKLALGLV